MRIPGKIAVVTGAGSGLGRAMAARFIAEGAQVIGGDINEEALASVAEELGGGFRGVRCDVTVEADVAHLITYAGQIYGRLDIAVANAGGGAFAPLHEMPVDEWRRVIDLCLTGVFLTVKHASASMIAFGLGGSIISIASLNAVQPAQGMSAYCAAKAGVAMFGQCAALELGPHKIRVNTIAPGLVQTPATVGFFEQPEIVDEFVENAPIGRFAQPEDIANLALFLASDEAGFITGTTHHIDGGAQTGRYPRLFELPMPLP